MRLLLPLSLCFLSLTSCSSVEESIEDRSILAAIDALRSAPAEDLSNRKKLVDALETKKAQGLLAQRARDNCAEAYRALIEGQQASRDAKVGLTDPAKASKDLLGELSRAEAKIAEAEKAMPGCEKAAAELRRLRR